MDEYNENELAEDKELDKEKNPNEDESFDELLEKEFSADEDEGEGN